MGVANTHGNQKKYKVNLTENKSVLTTWEEIGNPVSINTITLPCKEFQVTLFMDC